MSLTRRKLLTAALGASQLALLEGLGVSTLGSRRALAQTAGGPTKLLTLYVPGGWMPTCLWNPLSAADIALHLPPPTQDHGDPAYCIPSLVKNLDGSDQADVGAPIQRLRGPQMWNPAAMAAMDGSVAAQRGSNHVPWGYSWVAYELWKRTTVVHGIDQGTAAHDSGRISAMCGAAGSEYRAPAMHAWVANAYFQKYGNTRPIPSAALAGGLLPNPRELASTASPSAFSNVSALADVLSQRNLQAWKGLADRGPHPRLGYGGQPLTPATSLNSTALEEYSFARIRAHKGKTNSATDAFYENMHRGYQGVSDLLARDLVTLLEKTPGTEHLRTPFWSSSTELYGGSIGNGVANDSGSLTDRFNLTLKLLKSDLTTAISLSVPGYNDMAFDTHGSPTGFHFVFLRALYETLGRFLQEMQLTPAPGKSGSLLDDTLVVIFSEFGRSWPEASDHWPYTSVAFVGGGVRANQMIGNYRFPGPTGAPVSMVDEGNLMTMRPPTSADVVHTVLKIMGVENFFIPGPHGEIAGVRA
jgi:hypothetical protein